MALNLEVKYAAALTQEEREMLIKIEDIVKEAAWNVRQVLVTKWVPEEDKGKRVLYCLVKPNDPGNVLAYYNCEEMLKLTQATLEKNLNSEDRRQVPCEFTDRPAKG
ncbi:MAG: hypothetical protein WCT12_34260 [Verrucomicrobiota bacterium]